MNATDADVAEAAAARAERLAPEHHGAFRSLRVYSTAADGWTEARERGGDPPRGALLVQCGRCGAVGPRARLEGRACDPEAR